MHAVPREENSAPNALNKPVDKVQRIEEFDFPPTWQRIASMTSPSMLTTHAFLITVHQIANDFAVRTRCAQSKPPT